MSRRISQTPSPAPQIVRADRESSLRRDVEVSMSAIMVKIAVVLTLCLSVSQSGVIIESRGNLWDLSCLYTLQKKTDRKKILIKKKKECVFGV